MSSILPSSFGELLQELRKQKKIRQQWLAEKLGVHRNTIGAWERGERLPDTRGMVLELAKHLYLDEPQTRLLLEASLTATSSYWNLPSQRNPLFTGREDLLQKLHELLSTENTVTLVQSAALKGLGGIGKTQVALEYAYRSLLEYSAVLWVSAETYATITTSFETIAHLLNLPEKTSPKQEVLVDAVLRWLRTHKDWLLIFDNVENLALLQPFLPSTHQGSFLFTTRLQALGPIAQSLQVPQLSDEEGLQFLLRRAGLSTISATEQEAARILVQLVAGLPLALDQAGAYIEETACSVSEYLQLFRQSAFDFFENRGDSVDHPFSVVKTLHLAFEKVKAADPLAAHLFYFCAFLAPDAIPEELLELGNSPHNSPLSSLADPLLFYGCIKQLRNYSLLERDPETKTIALHRVTQAIIRDSLPAQERQMWTQSVLLHLESSFPFIVMQERMEDKWRRAERLIPHALEFLSTQKLPDNSSSLLASLLLKTARYLSARARFSESEALYIQARHLLEKQQDQSDKLLREVLYGLASNYRRQGKFKQAEPLLEAILAQRALLDSTEYIRTLHLLATIYGQQGKFSQAEPLFHQLLALRTQLLGENHPDVAITLNNLAIIACLRRDFALAEPLLVRALAIHEQALEPDHPEIAFAICNLAVAYYEQGKLALAEQLGLRALDLRKRALGPEHPDYATALGTLGKIYAKLGEAQKAETLLIEATAIFRRVNPLHPDRAEFLAALASISQQQEKSLQAIELYQQAIEIAEQTQEADHPTLQEYRQGLALLRKEVLTS